MSHINDPDVLNRIRILESREIEREKITQEQDRKTQEQDRKIHEQNQKILEQEAKYNELIKHRDSVQTKQMIIISASFLGGLCLGHYSTKLFYSLDKKPIPR